MEKKQLKDILRDGFYNYYKNCQDSFNECKFQRDMCASSEGETSRSIRAKCSNIVSFADERCKYCEKPAFIDYTHPQKNNSLHAADSINKDGTSQFIEANGHNTRNRPVPQMKIY